MIKINAQEGSFEAVGASSTLAADFCTGIQIVYEKLMATNKEEAENFKGFMQSAFDKDCPIYVFANKSYEEKKNTEAMLDAILNMLLKHKDED